MSTRDDARRLPRGSELASHWGLDQRTVFLNHGSFGATPLLVLEAQRSYRDLLERDPVRHFVELHDGLMDRARAALAAFVRCDEAGLALVPNASTGVATVFANVRLREGDEVLITGHEYLACQNIARRAAARAGAKVVVAPMPFPCTSTEEVERSVLGAVTPRTVLAMLSHVTSSSGLVLPVERLARELEARGVRVLVDGAHAPGMIPLDVSAMGASYYTANCHKWICSPKGSAMLHVREDVRESFRPLVLSNSANLPKPGRGHLHTEFDYTGTQDCTALYAIEDALRVIPALVPGGWHEVMRRNRALALEGASILRDALDVRTPAAPEDMLGSIVTMILPADPKPGRPSVYQDPIQDRLLREWGIQVPVWSTPAEAGAAGVRVLRISAQLYNAREQYEYLARALVSELHRERTLP